MYVVIANKAASTVITHPALSLIRASRSLRDSGFCSWATRYSLLWSIYARLARLISPVIAVFKYSMVSMLSMVL